MRGKENYVSNVSRISRCIILVLVFALVFNHLNLGLLSKSTAERILDSGENKVTNISYERDYSELENIEEIEELRTEFSKTYLKAAGIYETQYYEESIHFFEKGKFENIDNTLKNIDGVYTNTANRYSVVFPEKLNCDSSVEIKNNNNILKLCYPKIENSSAELNEEASRESINLKDSIDYVINPNETLNFMVSQNSVKENVILNKYIENYVFSYIIETNLRVEKIQDELYFFDGEEVIYKMNKYYMYDNEKNASYEIDFKIESLGNQKYEISVVPSNDFLKKAVYPVVIDPEILVLNGGFSTDILSITTVDKYTNTVAVSYIEDDFSIVKKTESGIDKSKRAYLDAWIPGINELPFMEKLVKNQFMYAYLELPTVSCATSGDAKAILKNVESMSTQNIEVGTVFTTTLLSEQNFSATDSFYHKFDIYDLIADNLDQLLTGDINLLLELSIEGPNNSSATYESSDNYWFPKPTFIFGYIDYSGLSDYYTYESLPISDQSNVYVAHNSGNLTYVNNSYSDGNLLNLSLIYNANRKHIFSPYGGYGFNINYNETLEQIGSGCYSLTLGNGRVVYFYQISEYEYLANDGSGDILEFGGSSYYDIISLDDTRKCYNQYGKLTNIYTDEALVEGITITYSNGLISRVRDSNGPSCQGSYIDFYYDQLGNLFGSAVYKYDPTRTNINNGYIFTDENYYETYNGKLYNIYSTTYNNGTYYDSMVSINYNSESHISGIYESSTGLPGYTFEYDNQNRITKAKVYGSGFSNGAYLDFDYDSNGKKTIITDALGNEVKYTFDHYYHTSSIESSFANESDGYTVFYQYKDIFFDEDGYPILEPNYLLNHKLVTQSNTFKNDVGLISNHGFEVVGSGTNINSWIKDVSGTSTAKVESSLMLYGSKVLEIDKKSVNDTARVYQEIPVENGKQYVIKGYIKNTNTTGDGAYIEATAVGSGSLTPLGTIGYVKGSTDFKYCEYKFVANYDGVARIFLTNTSVGKAYFDQISVNTNYTDTRYNYLENASFEKNISSEWNTSSVSLVDNDSFINNIDFGKRAGEKSLLIGPAGYATQEIEIMGNANDSFVFGAYGLYENYMGDCTVSLTVHYLTNPLSTQTVSFKFDSKNPNEQYLMHKLVAEHDYYKLTINICNNSFTKTWVDNVALYKEGYGINITHSDYGYVEEIFNEITGKTTQIAYDENNNVETITTDNDVVNYGYENYTNFLNYVESKNITTVFNLDQDGNIEDMNSTGAGSEILANYSSTTYTADGIFPATDTDVYGNVTTYTYDYLTGLVKNVINSSGVETDYTHDAIGNTTSITMSKDASSKTVSYTYDSRNRLTSITTGGLEYAITYNSYGDVKTVSVGGELLLTNNYQNENSTTGVYTGLVEEKQYSYGTVSFEYNEELKVSKVYYGLAAALEYTYNDYGEISVCNDLISAVTYYYNYDYQNKLINVNATNGNNVVYSYDENSNLVSKQNINGINQYNFEQINNLMEYEVKENLTLRELFEDENFQFTSFLGTADVLWNYEEGLLTYDGTNSSSSDARVYTSIKPYITNGSTVYCAVVGRTTNETSVKFSIYSDGTWKDSNTVTSNEYELMSILETVNSTSGDTLFSTPRLYGVEAELYQIKLINLEAVGLGSYTKAQMDELYDLYLKALSIEDTLGDTLTSEEIYDNSENLMFKKEYSYSTDSFAQLKNIAYYVSQSPILTKFEYETAIVGEAENAKEYYTGKIKSIGYYKDINNVSTEFLRYEYEYNAEGKIVEAIGYNGLTMVYQEYNEYDIFGQLIEQNIIFDDIDYTSIYNYDSRGNIYNYSIMDNIANDYIYGAFFGYESSNYKDEYEGGELYNKGDYWCNNIYYSSTGQPSDYFWGWDITYNMRSVASIYGNDFSADYAYNAFGIRTSKIVADSSYNYEETSYILEGNNIISEIHSGLNNYQIDYFYDSSGNIIGFTYNNSKYLYLKNIQNDIIGIVDENNEVIVKYYYDAFGKTIKIIDSSLINLSQINPFRYRSYYLDNETGLYYLNSRYYDTLTCRFISMDAVEILDLEQDSILQYNLFSYCLNDPVNMVDDVGYAPQYIDSQSNSAVANIRWGLSTIENSGCGAVAVYNVLAYYSNSIQFTEVVKELCRMGAPMGLGFLGANPLIMSRMLKKYFSYVKTISGINLRTVFYRSPTEQIIVLYKHNTGLHYVAGVRPPGFTLGRWWSWFMFKNESSVNGKKLFSYSDYMKVLKDEKSVVLMVIAVGQKKAWW